MKRILFFIIFFTTSLTAYAQDLFEDAVTTDSYYHVLQFNFGEGFKKAKFKKRLTWLAGKHAGYILTLGEGKNCVQGTCKDRNIVIRFANQASADNFFTDFQTYLSGNPFVDFTYIGTQQGIFEQFPLDVDGAKAYFFASIDTVNDQEGYFEYLTRFIEVSEPYNVALLLNLDRQCLIGNCPILVGAIGLSSLSEGYRWWYSEEMQALQAWQKSQNIFSEKNSGISRKY